VKNKVAPPFKFTELDLMHDKGISWEGDLIDLGMEDKLIDKSGAWLTYGEIRFQGRENFKQFLRENPALVEELRGRILEKRGLLGSPAPVEANGEAPKPEAPAKEPSKRERKAAAAAPAADSEQ